MERPRVTRNLDNPTIVILGAGNVATHLCGALSHFGTIAQVWSRDITHAQQLVALIASDARQKAQAISDLNDVIADADFYIISVPDNAIANVASQLANVNGVIAHTSGSVDMSVFAECGCKRFGVFYPLQTFSRNKAIDFSEIPFFIEGSDDETAKQLCALARKISNTVHIADSKQRASLHIAAVFACNFANHLWSIAADILNEANYPFSTLRPLLQETLNKAFEMMPEAAQTGPAKRKDMNVIDAHLAKLSGDEKQLYELITKMIIAKQHE